jgi:Ring finger domain
MEGDIVSREELIQLPCQHLFHTQCITDWLKLKCICPMCRMDVGKWIEDETQSDVNVDENAQHATQREQ